MSQYFNEHKLDEDKSKKLIVACANANREEVDRLLETLPNIPAIINEKNNQGETALHSTATGGDHYIIQRLLENGADLSISDKQGNTALMKAALMANVNAVQVILSFNPDSLFVAGSNGQLPLHCAALISNILLVNQFIEMDHERRSIKARDKEGNTVFHAAASPPCDPQVLDFLLQSGSEINEVNNKNETALLLTAKASANNAMKFLLEKGAAIIPSSIGMTALHECAFRKNDQGVKILLDLVKGIPLEAENSDKETPLALACAGGSKDCVNLLIQAGANMNRNCIHSAVKFERPVIVTFLLEKKVSINSLNDKGQTPLIIAAENNFFDLAKALLEGGADPTIKYSNLEFGRKPLTAAAVAKLKNYKEMHKMLKQAEKDGCLIV